MIRSIYLKNYRNISSFEQELASSTIIIAQNGSGKTNVLESIYFNVFGSTFRKLNSTSELILKEADNAKIRINWDNDQIETILSEAGSADLKKVNKVVMINGKKTTQQKVRSKYPLLLFAPSSVDLIIGEPALRRDDINNFLSNCYPIYSKQISRYAYILRNRNSLIKQIREGRAKKEQLTFWTNQLVDYALSIYTQRAEFFNEITGYFKEITKKIYLTQEGEFSEGNLAIRYIPCIEVSNSEEFKERLIEKFNQNIDKEIIVGKTLYGIQKDDYQLIFNNNDLRFIGSRGQQRIGTILIKLAQLEYFYTKFNHYPLLLLDDLMSELDDTNRTKIANYLKEKEGIQYILTSAEEKEIPKELFENSIVLRYNFIIK